MKSTNFTTKLLCWTFIASILFMSIKVKADGVIKKRNGLNNYCKSLIENSKIKEWKDGKNRSIYFGSPFICYKNRKIKGPVGTFYLLFNRYMAKVIPKRKFRGLCYENQNPSWFGAFRLPKRLRADKKIPLNLVVFDFSYFDRNRPKEEIQLGMESMIREVRGKYPETDILILYTFNTEFLKEYQAGKTPSVITIQEEIAEHYKVPSVNFAKYISDKIIAGETTLEKIAGESPFLLNKKGDQLCFQAIKPLIDECVAEAKEMKVLKKFSMPEKLIEHLIDKPKTVTYEVATSQPGWLGWQRSPLENCQHILRCDKPGPEVKLRFKGDTVGYVGIISSDTGDLEYSIDGSPWKLKKVFDKNSGGSFKTNQQLFAMNLDPDSIHELKLRVASDIPNGSKGRMIRIVKFLINGKPVFNNPYAGMTTLQMIDKIYADMEPVKYAPPADRWKYLPKTMKRLNEGGELKMVMLGDSIINNTSRSHFELLIERIYPKTKINKIRSVRGSTGCDWYQHENRVQEYVLKHNPDLLIIGGISNGGPGKDGISNKGGAEPIRNVIKQVRAKNPEIEIMVMTGAFGRNQDPKKIKGWSAEVDPNGKDYRSNLKRVAKEENVEFLDMRGLWGQYILDSKHPCGSFMSDPVHANDRGQQILGRILEKYFSK